MHDNIAVSHSNLGEPVQRNLLPTLFHALHHIAQLEHCGGGEERVCEALRARPAGAANAVGVVLYRRSLCGKFDSAFPAPISL